MFPRTCRNNFILGLAALLLFGAFLPAQAETEPATPGEGKLVYVIPVEGMIEKALLFVIRRGIKEAAANKADAVILDMDTPGGTVDAAREIIYTIQNASSTTYTFVRKDAFSAGAIIALGTDRIYMAPGSVIGAATPMMMSPMGGPKEMPEEVAEKMSSAVAALIRTTAQLKGHDEKVAEAMVRRDIEYKIGNEVISREGELLTLTNVEAERLVGKGKEKRPLLSRGTVASIEELLEKEGLSGAVIRRLEITDTERIARFIAALAPFFIMGGLLGFYVEIKTPGFGIPGILGLLSFALFYWAHNIAGLAGGTEILVFLIGIAFILVEVFVVPGFGIPGVLGITCVFWAVLASMLQHYPGGSPVPTWPQIQLPLFNLSLAIVGTGVFALVLGKYLPKSSVFQRLVLSTATTRESGYEASDHTTAELIGQRGVSLTPLHPAGSAMFGDKRLDVVTRGDYLDEGVPVEIVETHGNRIIVESRGKD